MRPTDWILTKRSGGALESEAIQALIDGVVSGSIPRYQISAWLMAVYFQGMTRDELRALVGAMLDSGRRYDWSGLDHPASDKHSTGGVGDKVSLILASVCAVCGLAAPMMSGRGLGHTGGTLDKLEAIPGFQTRLEHDAFERQMERISVAMIGQSEDLTPADRELYALRDVTGTVESIPLIASSIMSKKIAEGAKSLVLDVKVGTGAFMAELDRAQELARTMCEIGAEFDVNVAAWLTDMNQPLGEAIGNAMETREAIETLRGGGPADLIAVTETLCAEMLMLAGVETTHGAALKRVNRAIDSGEAAARFQQLIEAQGGDPRVVDNPDLLPTAPESETLLADRDGFFAVTSCREIGEAARALGAGRGTIKDKIDPSVGFEALKRVGDPVIAGDPLYRVAWRDRDRLDAARERLKTAFAIVDSPPATPQLIIMRQDANGSTAATDTQGEDS